MKISRKLNISFQVLIQIPKQVLMFRIQYNIQIIARIQKMLVNYQVGTIVSILSINRVSDECFGRRCSRCDDTLKRKRVPVKIE